MDAIFYELLLHSLVIGHHIQVTCACAEEITVSWGR